MKVNKNVIYRCIADEHILVPVGDTARDNNGLFVLNEVSAEIWKLLCEEKTREEIIAEISESFDADAETIASDTDDFLKKLTEAGLITL